MAFELTPIDNIGIPIPDGDGGEVTLQVPPLDCLPPADVDKINKKIESTPKNTPNTRNPKVNANAMIQMMLIHFNPKAEKVIWSLVPRHVSEINTYWEKESGISVGESEPSTGSSSGKTA